MTRQIKTSKTDPLRLDWLATGGGRVGMTIAPGKKSNALDGARWERDLDTDLEGLAAAGVTQLVCLLEQTDLKHLGINGLAAGARKRNIEFVHFPIVDVNTPRPEQASALEEVLEGMDRALGLGGRVVIHCEGGLGRTGTIAGCWLVRQGLGAKDALAELTRTRKSEQCPQTDAQREYIRQYVKKPKPSTTPNPSAVQPTAQSTPHASPTSLRTWHLHKWLDGDVSGDLTELRSRFERKVSVREAKTIVNEMEKAVALDPAGSFDFDLHGGATLKACGRRLRAGRLETPTLAELEERVSRMGGARPGAEKLRLSVLHGADSLTDIGLLQATAPEGTLFQVASQFNGLEAPGASLVDVADYFADPTQGPRAAISAFPGALLRHYRAPRTNGARFVQSSGDQLDFLADAIPKHVAEVKSGYLTSHGISNDATLANALDHNFSKLRVGLHSDVEVAFGHDFCGPVLGHGRIAQAFTSTIALGGYSEASRATPLEPAMSKLLRAAYLGTLLGAVDLRMRTVVLTMIGGGVFGNPLPTIWNAILWAFDKVGPMVPFPMEIVVNSRALTPNVPEKAVVEAVKARHGTFLEVSSAGLRIG